MEVYCSGDADVVELGLLHLLELQQVLLLLLVSGLQPTRLSLLPLPLLLLTTATLG